MSPYGEYVDHLMGIDEMAQRLGYRGPKEVDDPDCGPECQWFDIWSEGYAATGERAGAHYHGCARGVDFRDACVRFFRRQPERDAQYFDARRLTYWACKLFDNESAARRSFG
jgi:hypothetical protein